MTNVIEAEGLVRRFGDFTAVDGVSFEVREGEVFGFLGPNGAGKTTTINMLCTLLRPSGGTARVGGDDIVRRQRAVRCSIGLIFQDETLDNRLSAWQNLRFHAMLYGVPAEDFRRRSAELLEMVELTDKVDDPVKSFSGGMRRRLEIVRGLLHHPKVLFLDEPTIGLDPQTRRHIWDYLLRLRETDGLTLFLTTHYMDEAEYCDRMAIIDHGRIIALDTPDALKAMVGGDIVAFEVSDDDRAGRLLAGAHGVAPRVNGQGDVVVEVAEGGRYIPSALSVLGGADPPIDVASVNVKRPTLEDVFIKLTGRTIRDEGWSVQSQMRRASRAWRAH